MNGLCIDQQVSSLPNVSSHGVVNHSLTFVNLTNWVHTHPACRILLGPCVKTILKRMKARGPVVNSFPVIYMYLDWFMWWWVGTLRSRDRHLIVRRCDK